MKRSHGLVKVPSGTGPVMNKKVKASDRPRSMAKGKTKSVGTPITKKKGFVQPTKHGFMRNRLEHT